MERRYIMWSIGEVKEKGKNCFIANFWRCVLSAFLLSLLVGGGIGVSYNKSGSDELQALNGLSTNEQLTVVSIVLGTMAVVMIVSILLKIFIFNPLEVGCYGFFRENIDSEGQASLDVIKSGFQNYGHTFCTLFLRDLFLALWTMLLFIPGIIKFYSYRMVPYILRDNPELSATEVITMSRQMMDGHKWRAFVLDLSFIGWYLLGGLTFGIVNVLWTGPYHNSANAALYLKLKDMQ